MRDRSPLSRAIQSLRSEMLSASSDCLPEDVCVIPVVVPELEFGEVERQIFGADFVERADNAAFEDRPEAFNRVGVDRADDVLALGVVDNRMRVFGVEALVAAPLIGDEQAYLLGNRAAHEALEHVAANVADDAGDNLPFALNGADHRRLAGPDAASSAATAALVL